MKPAFGWTLLSRDDLKRAETQLRQDVQGVRDEIGFLALHQAYADRFFPGTSVLHTRLRYILFVPWMYQKLAGRGERGIAATLEREEITLAGRLKKHDDDGVIGGRSYPDPTSQPPSLVYWTALSAWRILRPLPGGAHPSRAQIHRALSRGSSSLKLRDEDRQLIDEGEPIFTGVPPPPSGWRDINAPLDFGLLPHEKRFVRGCLLAVRRRASEDTPSLLARLTSTRLRTNSELWDSRISAAADSEDRESLKRAEQAAALAAIGRAIYASLVETMRDREDRLPTENIHRKNLSDVIEIYRDLGLALDVDAVAGDAPHGISNSILTVLRETQLWLRQRKAGAEDLHRLYAEAESRRKGRRARLVNSLLGREKRAEWTPDEHPEATPLHYRWNQVRRLLLDLQEST